MVLNYEDIKVLYDCGSSRASKLAKDFQEWFEKENGYALYDHQIPTGEFVKWAQYPESRVIKYAKMGF